MTIATTARRSLTMPRFRFDARTFGRGTIELWLPASGLLGRVALGGAVATLFDRSGKGRDATQGTGANQPTFTVVGGQLCVQFDGTNDYLTCGNVLDLSGGMTWFAVFDFNSAASFPMVFARSDGSANAQYEARRNGTADTMDWTSDHTVGSAESLVSQTVDVDNPVIWIGSDDPNSSLTQSLNGATAGAQSWTNPANRSSQAESLLIGARKTATPEQFAAMNLYDLGIYSSAFSLGEHHALKRALSRAYGITVS